MSGWPRLKLPSRNPNVRIVFPMGDELPQFEMLSFHGDNMGDFVGKLPQAKSSV